MERELTTRDILFAILSSQQGIKFFDLRQTLYDTLNDSKNPLIKRNFKFYGTP